MFNFGPITRLKRHYTFGFDLHGIIDKDPKGFVEFFKVLKKEGNTIFVISGPKEITVRGELYDLDHRFPIFIDKVFSIVDFLKSKNIRMKQDEEGNYWANDVDWWSSKAIICQENDVDYMIDDTFTYKQFFNGIPTKFIHIPRKKI